MPKANSGKPMFHDFVSLEKYSVEEGLRGKMLDSVMESIDKQKKNKDPNQIHGLEVTAAVSHMGISNGNNHIYMPHMVRLGIDTWTTPYEKPVLTHHNTYSDPIGRVTDSTYIKTRPAYMPQDLYDRLDNLTVHTKKTLKPLFKQFQPFLNDKRNRGLGFIRNVANVTDEDSIKKILDKRYKTLSISYDTESLHCNIDFQDWLKDGPCKHTPGKVYDGVKMSLIFGEMSYGEESFVNEPADEFAQTEHVKKMANPINTLLDSKSFTKNNIDELKSAVMSDSLSSHSMDNICSSGLCIKQNKNHNNNGDTMTLKKLKDSKNLLELISNKVSEESRLTDEQFSVLKDKDFVGANKLFPAVSVEYIDASIDVLSEVEDSDEKAQLSQLLEDRKKTLTKDNSSDNTDSTDDTQDVDYSVSIDDKGNISFSDENRDSALDNKIAEFILDNMDSDTSKALAKKLISSLEDSKDFSDSLAKDSLDSYKSQVENLENERTAWEDSLKEKDEKITHLSEGLKDFLVSDIISYRQNEDPEVSEDQLIKEFSSKTLTELDAIRDGLSKLFSKDSDEIVPSATDDNPSENFNDGQSKVKITQEMIDSAKALRQEQYIEFNKRDSKRAELVYKLATDRILAMEQKLKSQTEDK